MVKISLDTRAFDKALEEYKQFSKKAPSEIINSKLYFIARNCTTQTKAVDKSSIISELNAPSRVAPRISLAHILVNRKNKMSSKKRLYGNALEAAAKKLIAARIRSISFLRSGWIPAILKLQSLLLPGEKRGAPKQGKVSAKGSPKGRAVAALPNGDRSYGEIENNIIAKGSAKANNIMQRGLQAAVDLETKSIINYIEKKYNDGIAKFNR